MTSYSGYAPTLLVEQMYILDHSLLSCHGGYGDGLGEPPTVIDESAKTGETCLPPLPVHMSHGSPWASVPPLCWS